MGQLTLDGGEVERSAGGQPLSPLQERVLRELRERGTVRSVEVGKIAHELRGECGYGRRTASFQGRGIACCAYAAVDGNEIMKRLAERGLARRVEPRGTWAAAAPHAG